MEKKKIVTSTPVGLNPIVKYCESLENNRFVGGGTCAPVASALAMSLFIKIANVVKKRNITDDKLYKAAIGLLKFRHIYLWLADKDAEIYEYIINCHRKLKGAGMYTKYMQTNLFEKMKVLGAAPSIITISHNESEELVGYINDILDYCPDTMKSDFNIATHFMVTSSMAAEETIEANLGKNIKNRPIITQLDEIGRYKSEVDKMIEDLCTEKDTKKEEINKALDALNSIWGFGNKDMNSANIAHDGTNITINISGDLLDDFVELLTNKLNSDNIGK